MIDPFEVVIAIATALATLASIVALVFSVIAYRQRIKFHPQPHLVPEWSKRVDPSSGFFFRSCTLWNHGDAPARDLEITTDSGTSSDGSPWDKSVVLEPGKHFDFRVPLVDRVVQTVQAGLVHYDRSGDPGDYRTVTPTVTVTRLQPPFEGKRQSAQLRPPPTPDIKP
jgi:hypothetical protein